MTRNINWITVLLALVAGMAVGFLWYGFLFVAPWMAGNGITQQGDIVYKNSQDISTGTEYYYLINTLVNLVSVIALHHLNQKIGINTLLQGAALGALIGLLLLLNVATTNMFAHNSLDLTWIDGGYAVVLLTVLGAIMGARGTRKTA
jgi:hypothetical protein